MNFKEETGLSVKDIDKSFTEVRALKAESGPEMKLLPVWPKPLLFITAMLSELSVKTPRPLVLQYPKRGHLCFGLSFDYQECTEITQRKYYIERRFL